MGRPAERDHRGRRLCLHRRRTQAIRIGPCHDELGVFGTLIARFGPRRSPRFEGRLRAVGEGPILDLVEELESAGEKDRLVDMEVNEALGYLWPRLRL